MKGLNKLDDIFRLTNPDHSPPLCLHHTQTSTRQHTACPVTSNPSTSIRCLFLCSLFRQRGCEVAPSLKIGKGRLEVIHILLGWHVCKPVQMLKCHDSASMTSAHSCLYRHKVEVSSTAFELVLSMYCHHKQCYSISWCIENITLIISNILSKRHKKSKSEP